MYCLSENILTIECARPKLLRRLGSAYLNKDLFEQFNFFNTEPITYLFYVPPYHEGILPPKDLEIVLDLEESVINVNPQQYVLSGMHFFTEFPPIKWVETFYEKFKSDNVDVKLYYMDQQRYILGQWINGQHTSYINTSSWKTEDFEKLNIEDDLIDAFGLLYMVEDAFI